MIFGIRVDLAIKDNFTSIVDKNDNIVNYYLSGTNIKDHTNMDYQLKLQYYVDPKIEYDDLDENN